MQIRSIEKFQVFDLRHIQGHAPSSTTLLSLGLDGQRIYGLSIPGVHALNSGSNTLVAFKNADPTTLLGWIDPLSGECFVLPSTFRSLLISYLLAAFIGALLIWTISSQAHAAIFFGVVSAIGILMSLINKLRCALVADQLIQQARLRESLKKL